MNALGSVLRVSVHCELVGTNGLGMFDCRIQPQGEDSVLAQAPWNLRVPSKKPSLTGRPACTACQPAQAATVWAMYSSPTQAGMPASCRNRPSRGTVTCAWALSADASSRQPELPALAVVRPGMALGRAPRAVLSNSFAFGRWSKSIFSL